MKAKKKEKIENKTKLRKPWISMGKLYDGVLQGKATASECHLAINVKLRTAIFGFNGVYTIHSLPVVVLYFCAATPWMLKKKEEKIENKTK